MGVPTSEVGYTIATTRRETTEVHKNMWWHSGEKRLFVQVADLAVHAPGASFVQPNYTPLHWRIVMHTYSAITGSFSF